MKKNSISMLIVVYNKKLQESITLNSLLGFENRIDNLLIVNNGPKEIELNCNILKYLRHKHNNVELQNCTENKPLSWVYNDFTNKYETELFVFFDDDTPISYDFEKTLFSLTNTDVELPKIFAVSDSVQYYPLVDETVWKHKSEIDSNCCVFSIGSGLTISNNIVNEFKKNNIELFDSRFALYGVDTSFFRRLNFLNNKGASFEITSYTKLDHSLSRTEGKISQWRYIERLYDAVLSIKYYQKLKLLRLLKLCLKNIYSLKFLKIIIKTYIVGSHPRCQNGKVKTKCH